VEVTGRALVENKGNFVEGQSQRPPGMINIRIKMKEVKADGSKPRKLDTLFGKSDSKMNVYDNFVKQLSEQKKNGRSSKTENRRKSDESEAAPTENSAPNKIKN
jgi:chemotaxis protein MotB